MVINVVSDAAPLDMAQEDAREEGDALARDDADEAEAEEAGDVEVLPSSNPNPNPNDKPYLRGPAALALTFLRSPPTLLT